MEQDLINKGLNIYLRNEYSDIFHKNLKSIQNNIKADYPSIPSNVIDTNFETYSELYKYVRKQYYAILQLYELNSETNKVRKQFEEEFMEKVRNKYIWIDSKNLHRLIDVIKFQNR